MRNPFRHKPPRDPRPLETPEPPEAGLGLRLEREPSVDPLDPHGDGTIRQGDPMWEVFERMMTGESGAMLMQRNDDDTWTVEDLDRGKG